MIKLKELLKETKIQIGKLYTAKDHPPFKTEKLTEEKNWPEMKKGDYLKDVYKMGQLDVVIRTEKFKGEYQVWINPKGSNKAIVGVSYDPKQFVDSGKKKGGKTIWVVKK